MSTSEKTEDLLLRLFKQCLIEAYTLFMLLATGFIVVGKYLFDLLYVLVKKTKERKAAKEFVESSSSQETT
jgi:hypothetical protein